MEQTVCVEWSPDRRRTEIYFPLSTRFQKNFTLLEEANVGVCLQPGALCVGRFKATRRTVIVERLTPGLRIWKVFDIADYCQFAPRAASQTSSPAPSSHGFMQTYNDVTDINLRFKSSSAPDHNGVLAVTVCPPGKNQDVRGVEGEGRKHQHIDWALFLQRLAARRRSGRGQLCMKRDLKYVLVEFDVIILQFAACRLFLFSLLHLFPVLAFSFSLFPRSKFITRRPWAAGEISSIWIINEVLIDQIPAEII